MSLASEILKYVKTLIVKFYFNKQNLSNECTLAKQAKEELNHHYEKAQKEVIGLEKSLSDVRSQLVIAKQQREDVAAEKDGVCKEKEEVSQSGLIFN